MTKASRIIHCSLLLAIFVSMLSAVGISNAQAAQKAELWARWQKNDPSNGQSIDHASWNRLLKQLVVAPHPSGINRVRYQAVTANDVKNLKDYLQSMQALA